MTNATKLALEESLKHLLLKKPLDKITINDLTTDCGISRMTFYYHFKDIYDLVERGCPHPLPYHPRGYHVDMISTAYKVFFYLCCIRFCIKFFL